MLSVRYKQCETIPPFQSFCLSRLMLLIFARFRSLYHMLPINKQSQIFYSCQRGLLKTLWKKGKMPVASFLSYSQCFMLFEEKSKNMSPI